MCHSEFEFLHLLCEKNNIHPIIVTRAVRHLALRSEASKPAQIGTEPSLFIFQTLPSSPIPAFLASSLLWQGVYPKLEGEMEVSRKMSKFIYCGQKTLKMQTVGRATRKSGVCNCLCVYSPADAASVSPSTSLQSEIISQRSSTVGSCRGYVQFL